MAQYLHRNTSATGASTMETYIKVSFWTGVIVIALRCITLAWGKYPRTTDHSRASDVLAMLIQAGIVIWAGSLLSGA